MKNKINYLISKKYLFLFILIMVINIALAGILLRVSFGQTKKEDFSSQKPVKVEVVEQKNSPFRITVVNIDNYSLSHQEVICSLQNIGDKSIRAYTLLGDVKSGGKIITSFFAEKVLRAGESVTDSLPMERQNIKEDETIFISIDYIEFADGSFWGADSVGKSTELAGIRAGTRAAITYLKDLTKKQGASGNNGITNLLKQELREIAIDVPNVNQSEEWKKGFRMGYRGVISILQRVTEPKIENLIKKLDELEKNAN